MDTDNCSIYYLEFNSTNGAPITCSFLAIGPRYTNSNPPPSVSTFNSNFLSKFNSSTKIDLLSSVSTPTYSQTLTISHGNNTYTATYNARYFYLGELLIQFTDFSSGIVTCQYGFYTVNFPTPFGGMPYVVVVSPAGGSGNPNYNYYITLVSYTASSFYINVNNTNAQPSGFTFLAIGPRYASTSSPSTSNSNFLSNFNNTSFTTDILSTLSTPATNESINLSGTSKATTYTRYFYLGNLLIQFSDFSSSYSTNYLVTNSQGQTYSMNFPIAFSGEPYVVIVTPWTSSSWGNDHGYNIFTSLVSYSATGFNVYIGNNYGNFTFLAIGPR